MNSLKSKRHFNQPGKPSKKSSRIMMYVRMFGLTARHLPVVENGELVGILRDRDISLAEALSGDLERLLVRQAMTARPFTCGPGAHLHAVASEMAEHKYGTAIVVDREHPGHVVGLFTTTDALRALARLCGHA